MADCTGYPTPKLAKDYATDAKVTSEILTSSEPLTPSKASDGKQKKTFAQIELEANEIYSAANGVHKGDYALGVIYSKYNEYYTYNNSGTIQQWSVKDTVPLDYVTTQSNPNNDPNLTLRGDASQGYVGSVTNYQAASVADMIAGLTFGGETIIHTVGQVWDVSTDTYKVQSISVPVTIDDFIKGPFASFHFEGDSITEGNVIGYKYSDLFAGLQYAKNQGQVRNTAVGGSWIPAGSNGGNNITDRYTSDVFPHRPSANGGDGGEIAFLFVMAGTNDLSPQYGNRTATQVIADLTAYTTQAISDGFTVILQTIIPKKSGIGFWEQVQEAYRLEVNNAIIQRLIPATYVADTASIVSNPYDSNIYVDPTHPTVDGSRMIGYYLNSLMTTYGAQVVNVTNLHSPTVQGNMTSQGKMVGSFGEQICRTWIGYPNTETRHGLIHLENIDNPVENQNLWQYNVGSNGSYYSLRALDDNGFYLGDAYRVGRNGGQTWVEFGSGASILSIGFNGSGVATGGLRWDNIGSGVGVNEKKWEIKPQAGGSKFELLSTLDDAGNRVNSFEAVRSGDTLENLTTPSDITVTNSAKGFVLTSPNGTNYRLAVGDNGALSTVVVP